MNAHAEYPVSLINDRCGERLIEIIESFNNLKDSVENSGNKFASTLHQTMFSELQVKLIAINNLAKMCSTIKTYGETSEKYITLDLDCVNLLWSNN